MQKYVINLKYSQSQIQQGVNETKAWNTKLYSVNVK